MKRVFSVVLCVVMLLAFSSCKKDEPIENFCEADEGKISVISLDAVDGLFVEKGNQDKVESVATIIVKNNSDRMLEYGTVVFNVNEYERAEFVISALPAGEKCLVMETTARRLEKDDEYKLRTTDSVFAYCDASVQSEKYELTVDNSTFKLQNKTDIPLTAKIAYKYYKDGMYYGGIAFRGTFESVQPHTTMEKTSKRFTDDCKIVNITTE